MCKHLGIADISVLRLSKNKEYHRTKNNIALKIAFMWFAINAHLPSVCVPNRTCAARSTLYLEHEFQITTAQDSMNKSQLTLFIYYV